MKRFVILFLLAVSPLVNGAPEILWYSFEREFIYKDIDQYCSSKSSPNRFLMAIETVDGLVKGAVLKQNNLSFASKISFSSSELSGVQIKTDSSNRKWISSLFLSSRLLTWIFQQGGATGCKPEQCLATLGPNQFHYVFDLGNILHHPLQVSSNLGEFYGQRTDGRYFQISLSLNQTSLP